MNIDKTPEAANDPSSGVRCSAWLGHSTENPIILTEGQKILIHVNNEHEAQNLWKSMPQVHREALQLEIRSTESSVNPRFYP